MRETRILSYFIVALASIQEAFAAGVDWKPVAQAMGNVWNLLGALFSFQYVSNNPVIVQGIFKFLVFILLLRVIQTAVMKAGFLKSDDKKTPVVIAAVVAAITVWFTPNVIIFSGIIALGVPILVIGGLTYVVFEKLKGNRIKHFFGVIVMFLTWQIAGFLLDIYKNPRLGGVAIMDASYMPGFVSQMLNIIYAICGLLFVVKLILWLFNGEIKMPGMGSSEKTAVIPAGPEAKTPQVVDPNIKPATADPATGLTPQQQELKDAIDKLKSAGAGKPEGPNVANPPSFEVEE